MLGWSYCSDYLNPADIAQWQRLAGGDCAKVYLIDLIDGTQLVLKDYGRHKELADAERAGYDFLNQFEALRLPKVLHSNGPCLLLSYVADSTKTNRFWESAAEQLAALHACRHHYFGAEFDNFIGLTPQDNTVKQSWVDFFIDARITKQLHLVADAQQRATLLQLFERAENNMRALLDGCCRHATPVHGDLWGGNLLADADACAVFIDPAPYFGHGEVDLAMSQLFGRFDERFYQVYYHHHPPESGWQERYQIYNLYHYLNHLNMFGDAYLQSCLQILRRFT